MKSIVNEASKKLTKLRDFTSSSVSLAFEAIFGGGASIRHGAFIRGGRLIQLYASRGAFLRYGTFILEWTFIRSFTVNIQIFPPGFSAWIC